MIFWIHMLNIVQHLYFTESTFVFGTNSKYIYIMLHAIRTIKSTYIKSKTK